MKTPPYGRGQSHLALPGIIMLGAIWFPAVCTGQLPNPFGFTIGKTSYTETLEIANNRKWGYQEYEKKHFMEIEKKDPNRGKNTFLKMTPKGLDGVRTMYVFFNSRSIVDALFIIVDPTLFEIMMEELDEKYELVNRDLVGEGIYSQYPRVLWQNENVYIELQKPGPSRVRVIYVEKLLYENYKDFIQQRYEPHRKREQRKNWMDEL